jgi:cysteinyl-tRNA synthetase
MLVGSLTVDSVKMSKSLGNFRTIKDALESYRPEVIRSFILTAHYSNPVDYSDDALDAAEAGWSRIYNAVRLVRQQMNTAPDTDDGNAFLKRLAQAQAEFTTAMDDDFNAPQAMAALQSLTKDANTLLNSDATVGLGTLQAINDLYGKLGGDVLGIVPQADGEGDSANAELQSGLIEYLIELRAQARANKNFAEADAIRNRLTGLGVQLDDRPDGTIWRVV